MLEEKNAIRVATRKYGTHHSVKEYFFRCLECATEIKSTKAYLSKHTGKCVRCAQWGEPFKAVHNELIKNCTRRKLTLSITYKDFLTFTKVDKCHYCNNEIKWHPHTKKNSKDVEGARAYKLDRMDNSKGYSMDNSVVCCFRCNRAKSDKFTYQEWFSMTAYFRNL